MYLQRDDRAPRKVRGQSEAAGSPSVRVMSAPPREPVSESQWQLYQRAAVTIYQAGEPRELTRARDDLEAWLAAAEHLTRTTGQVALVPHVVASALRFGGWAA